MKLKKILPGLLVAVCGVLGVYALVKSHGTTSAPSDEEAVPTKVSVQVGQLKRMTLHDYVIGYGTVEPAPATATEPAAEAPLAAPSAGVVAGVNVIVGQHVEKGDVIATVNSGAATLEYAEQEVARQKKLFSQHDTSLKKLQDAEAQLAALRVVTPLSGTVIRVNVKPGAAVDVNTVVAQVMDLNRLVVKSEIPASQAAKLKPEQEMQVLTEPSVTARLFYVSHTVNTTNDTVLVRSVLPPDNGLRPGQFVHLRVVTGVHTNCLAAPEESVVTDIAGQSVIALVQGDEAVQKSVQTGFRENGWVEVVSPGLKEGDSIVTVGAYGLPGKTQIQVVNSSPDETATANPNSSPAQ